MFKNFIAKYFSSDNPIDDRICYLMGISGTLANTYGLICTISIHLPLLCQIIGFVSEIFMITLTILAFKKKNTHFISVLMTIVIGNIIFPVMFLTEGGLQGGMAFYFMLPSICIAFTIRKPVNIILVILSLIENSALIYISYYHPNLIIPIGQESVLPDMISCSICVYLFLFFFTLQYAIQCKRDRQKIAKLSRMYCHQANTDELTDLFNRRYFKENFSKAIEENNSSEEPDSNLYLAMFDIDDFKKINDTYGHPFGDKVLKNFAEILFEESTNGSLCCRYGGEEFLIMIKASSEKIAYAKVELILHKTRTRILCGIEKKPVTVSAGFTVCEKGMVYAAILQNVDAKLYRAKKAGKNRIES